MTRSDTQGFTLLELLVVIAIIGSLMALELPAVQRPGPEIKPEVVPRQPLRPEPGEKEKEKEKKKAKKDGPSEGSVVEEGARAVMELLALDLPAIPELERLATPERMARGVASLDGNGDGRIDLEEVRGFEADTIDPTLAGPLRRVLEAARRDLTRMTESERRSVSVSIPVLARRSKNLVLTPEGLCRVARVILGEGALREKP